LHDFSNFMFMTMMSLLPLSSPPLRRTNSSVSRSRSGNRTDHLVAYLH